MKLFNKANKTESNNTRKVSKIRRSLVASAVAAMAIGGVVASDAGAANAASFAGTVNLTPLNTAYLMLDVQGGSQAWGAPIIQWYANGGANQKWNFLRLPDGNYNIQNVNSGQCMTTDGVAGDTLYQFPCVGAWTQEWRASLSNVGTSNIINAYDGLAVDVYGGSPWAGAPIDAWYYTNNYNQKFGEFFA